MANNLQQSKRGVVILFAVLLVSVVLTISLGIFNITYRQLVLSSIARESEVAFAVADSARNCAMYWNSSERVTYPFGHYSYDGAVWSLVPRDVNNITCAGDSNIGVTRVDDSNHLFQIIMQPDPNDSTRQACARVFVNKTPVTSGQKTTITVDGYNLANTSGGDCTPTNLNRAVNRRLVTEI